MAEHYYGGVVFYDSWDEAARASKWDKAIGSLYIEHNGRRFEAEIVKTRHGEAEIFYKGCNIKIRKATSREVDSARRWVAQA